MIQKLKIVCLLSCLLTVLSFVSSGKAIATTTDLHQLVKHTGTIAHSEASLATIKADHHNPYTATSIFDELEVELEPDEEDDDSKKALPAVTLNRARLLYHSKAPPVQKASFSANITYHSPLYILFEVFRI